MIHPCFETMVILWLLCCNCGFETKVVKLWLYYSTPSFHNFWHCEKTNKPGFQTMVAMEQALFAD